MRLCRPPLGKQSIHTTSTSRDPQTLYIGISVVGCAVVVVDIQGPTSSTDPTTSTTTCRASTMPTGSLTRDCARFRRGTERSGRAASTTRNGTDREGAGVAFRAVSSVSAVPRLLRRRQPPFLYAFFPLVAFCLFQMHAASGASGRYTFHGHVRSVSLIGTKSNERLRGPANDSRSHVVERNLQET